MADRSISLQIIADAKDFQREIAKLPGMTEKSAAAAALRMSKEMHKGFNKVEKNAKESSKQTGKLSSAALVGGFAGAAAGIMSQIVPALTAIPGKVTEAIGNAADVQNELSDLAAETGFSVDQLALLRLGANAAGKELSVLEGAFRPLSKKVGDFVLGTGEAKIGLERLGFTAEDFTGSDGSMIAAGDAFEMIKGRLLRVESSADQADIAMRVFGEGAGHLINVLGLVGDESSALARFQETLGLNTDEARQAAAEYQVTSAMLGETFKLVGQTLLTELTPAFESVAIAMVHAIEPMKIFIGKMDDLLVVGLKASTGGAVAQLKAVSETVGILGDAYDEWGNTADTTAERVAAIREVFDSLQNAQESDTEAININTGALSDNTDKVKANTAARQKLQALTKDTGTVAKILLDAQRATMTDADKLKSTYEEQMHNLFDIKSLHIENAELTAMTDKAAQAILDTYKAQLKVLQDQEDAAKKAKTMETVSDSLQMAGEAAAIFGDFANMAFQQTSDQIDRHNDKMEDLNDEYNTLKEQLVAVNEGERAALANLEEKGRLTEEAKKQIQQNAALERRALNEQIHLNRNLKKEERERKQESVRLARRQFKMTKAANVAEAFMNSGQAGIAAAANFPPPNPLFFVSLGLIAGQLAASLAAIKSQKMPSFHTGGVLGSDEGMFIGRRGESVLSERATQMIGQSTVQSLNEGKPMQPIVVNVNVGRRRLQQVVLDAMPSTDSHVGIMNPYAGR